MRTVREEVVESGLCLGCGTCESVCPTDAINLEINEKGFYIPSIDEKKCINCGLCVRVCPGLGIDVNKMNHRVFNKVPKDAWLGNFLNTYIGYATDKNIRYNASSGGIITALASYAVEKGIVDGVIVTRLGKDGLPHPVITSDVTEILNSAGSKYAPVPVNTLLRQIVRNDKKYLFVGLPCHIHGILKAEKYFPQLKEKIWLKIGLFCGGTASLLGTEFVLWLYGLNNDVEEVLKYRGDGWPGVFSAKTKKGEYKKIPYTEYYPYFGAYYINPRCRLCMDHTAEFADISVGDPWLPGFKDPLGSSIIISRTKTGEALLQMAKKDGVIDFREIPAEDVFESQIDAILYKKSDLTSRGVALGLKKLPDYGSYTPQGYPKYLAFLQTLIYTRMSSIFAYNKKLWPLLKLYHKTVTRGFWLLTGRLKHKYKQNFLRKYANFF